MSSSPSLAIDAHLNAILDLWEGHPNFILQSSPGSGKTTRVPPAMLRSKFLPREAQIWVLLPRRLAAKIAALRVAQEWGEKVGGKIGYQFRFERARSNRTQVLFLTEGMFTRKLLQDPHLKHVHTVLLDEFHERSLQSDFALAYLRWLQEKTRSDLKIGIMSATLETTALSRALGDAPVFKIQTPQYEVERHYLSQQNKLPMETLVVEHLKKFPLGAHEDSLVFLPGMAEIRRTEKALKMARLPPMEILPLHGTLPPVQQQEIFKKFSRPKVVLATNIAESSLTIPGLKRVIDTGWHRQAEYSWWSGIPRLQTRPISQASAEQRAGRAGRTGPGHCYRLYTQWDLQSRPHHERPEIQRADLSQMLLEALDLGLPPWDQLPWLEPPPRPLAEHGLELLGELGALERKKGRWSITPLGRDLIRLPLHPRLGRLLLEAGQRGVPEPALNLAARLSEGDMDPGPLEISSLGASLQGQTAQLYGQLKKNLEGKWVQGSASDGDKALGMSLLKAFPDRVGARSGPTWHFSQGGTGSIPKALWQQIQDIHQDRDFGVILDVGESKRQGELSQIYVRSWFPLEVDWLYEAGSPWLQEHSEIKWLSSEGRLEEVDQIRYGALILESSSGRPRDWVQASRCFLREALKYSQEKPWTHIQDLLTALNHLCDASRLERPLAKWKCLYQARLIPSIPPPQEILSERALLQLFHGLRTQEELNQWPFEERILEVLPAEAVSQWQRWLPDQISLPGRPRVKVQYYWDQEPFLASRLQDFFGLAEGPSLLAGRIPLTLKLLAPNQRPVQVTKDLKSFWINTYPELRRTLSRRYPKHAWPESP